LHALPEDSRASLRRKPIPCFRRPSSQAAFAFARPSLAPVCRRAWRAIAVTKHWLENDDGEPWERLVAEQRVELTVQGAPVDLLFRDGFED